MNKIDYINEKIKVRNKTLVVQFTDIAINVLFILTIFFTSYSSLSLFLTWLTFQAFAKTYTYSRLKKMNNISREFELKFGEELKRDVKDLKKQLQEELLKQKTNKFVDEEENNEVHVYKVSENNKFDNNIIDMELSNTYVKENNKTLKKVKERRY